VLLARDHVLNRLVAIKDFLPDLPPAARVRVVREMQVTARLIHPNIVRAYTYGLHADGSRPFMVMEYIPGHTLQSEAAAFHADPHRKLTAADPTFARLVAAVAQACDGIHFAHTQGVLHRDPKPANIVVREDGRTVVIDWGLAKVTGPAADLDDEAAGALAPYAGDAAATHDGLLGTPAYMAPEQIRGTTPGPATDIYTLGVGLFEVLTGGHPYVAPTLNELLQKVLFGKPDRPREVRPDVPVELEAVCAAAMAYRPEERYPTAAALADDLRAWLAGRPVSVRHRGRLRRLWELLTGRG
jgi:serine/threonine protein kinase